ncbi:hypothetical protein D5086_003506 [Populus alba]|uniref:Uncharacterized protein n=1 Tax=Populus alba TaxID=43335 RepID=A0ACC4D6U9_POPAL
MAMEDWTESTRSEELMVINEAGGSRGSQGQGGYLSDMLDTENLTQSRTREGIALIDQVRVYEEQGADVADGGEENLTDNFTRGVSIVTEESRVSEGLDAHKAKGEALLTTKLRISP